MSSHKFICRECPATGELSWFIDWMYKNNDNEDFIGAQYPGLTDPRKLFSGDRGRRDQFSRLLAHDALEHKKSIRNLHVQELYALGRIFAHRSDDFINGFGQDNMHREIGVQVAGLWGYQMPNEIPFGHIRGDVKEYVTDIWDDIRRTAEFELDCYESGPSEMDWRRLKSITWHSFCAGYMSIKGEWQFHNLFLEFQDAVLDACDHLYGEYGEHYEGMKFSVIVEKGEVRYKTWRLDEGY